MRFIHFLSALLMVIICANPAVSEDRSDSELCRFAKYRRSRTSHCDADRDGLTNIQEKKLRTNPFRKDTDKDGLTDGKEVKKYHTNPRKADTDGDGFSDGEEVLVLHSNPRDPKDPGTKKSTPLPGLPTATPTPVVPGASCTPQPDPFDSNGNTSSFGIPASLTGNIAAGQTQFNQTCFGCHKGDRGTNYTYQALSTAVSGPPMMISNLTSQQLADLTAYLNRTNIPPTPGPDCNSSSTPVPTATATPVDDRTAGELVFTAGCSGCHTNPNSLRDATRHEIEEAIQEQPEMSTIILTDEQYRVLLIYLNSL